MKLTEKKKRKRKKRRGGTMVAGTDRLRRRLPRWTTARAEKEGDDFFGQEQRRMVSGEIWGQWG
jgi:hypothetical protein